ncbi:hypothetical protein NIES4106_23400 [Fischerella sp. NIES-4106]|nr:hypothetical protein NIES4106_23400 [Fischerella sp. NIES-4106]
MSPLKFRLLLTYVRQVTDSGSVGHYLYKLKTLQFQQQQS